jgi:hypothetical protein
MSQADKHLKAASCHMPAQGRALKQSQSPALLAGNQKGDWIGTTRNDAISPTVLRQGRKFALGSKNFSSACVFFRGFSRAGTAVRWVGTAAKGKHAQCGGRRPNLH